MSVIQVTESDSGKVLPLRVGDGLMIELKENPTTGYRWDIESLGGCSERTPPAAGETSARALPGAAGKFRIHLIATAPGENEVLLKHWRDWEGERSVNKRFQMTLQIAD